MSYRISAKNRRLKRTILKFFGLLKFEGTNLNNAQKTILFGVFLGLISVFFPWIEIIHSNIVNNGFSKILGITGIIILLLNIFVLYLAIDYKNKEILKNIFHIFMKDGIGIIFLGFFVFLTTINAIFIIQGLETFQQGVILGNGIFLSIVGSSFVLIGGFFLSKEKISPTLFYPTEEIKTLDDFLSHERKVDEKNNMKLPF